MPGLVMAARAGNRMQARQTYRTINRMERRRGMMQNAMSGGSSSQQQYEEPQYAPPPQQVAPGNSATASSSLPYAEELKALAQLHAQGVLTAEEYEAKKKQLLGI